VGISYRYGQVCQEKNTTVHNIVSELAFINCMQPVFPSFFHQTKETNNPEETKGLAISG
jgi:hypothetical protein